MSKKTLLISALLLILLVAVAPAEGAKAKDCPPPPTWDTLTVVGVSCARGQDVFDRYGAGNKNPLGFRCERFQAEGGKGVNCTKDNFRRSVTWGRAYEAAASSGEGALVTAKCLKGRAEPRTVIIFCGDAGLLFSRLEWSSFGGSKAEAEGIQRAKTCDPDCASGGIESDPVTLVFSKLKPCEDQEGRRRPGRYYSRVRATTTDDVESYAVPCPIG